MNPRRYLQFLMAAKLAKSAALAMDGTPANNFNGFVDLESHDRRFHHGHYEEGQTCKLRDMLGRRDVVDMIAPEANDTSHEQVISVISGARSTGLLDDDDHRALMNEYNAIRAAAEDMDNLADSTLQQWATRIRDFNAVYNSLAAANQEEPPPPQAAEPETPPEPQPAAPSPSPAPAPAQVAAEQPTPRVPPIQRLVGDYRARLVSGFPTNNTAKRRLLGATGKATVEEAIRELIDHPENPQYTGILDAYTESALRHPSSWAGRMMGTIERLHPSWREEAQATVAAASANAAEYHGTPATMDQILAMRRDNEAVPELDRQLSGFVAANRQTTQMDKAAAAEKRLADTYSTSTSPARDGMAYGCNCWKTVLATLCRIRGFNVVAKSESSDDGQRPEFRKSQEAMLQHYERVNVGTREDIEKNLRRIAKGDVEGHPPTLPYPNGSFLMSWSGGHCTAYMLWKGKFHFIDPWHDYFSHNTVRDERLIAANEVATDPNRNMERMRRAVNTDRNVINNISERVRNNQFVSESDYTLRLAYFAYQAARHAMPLEERRTASQEDIIRRAAHDEGWAKINGSFIIKPSDALIPEIFQLVRRA